MDHVHQCPACPLGFRYSTELDFHLRAEHPEHHHEYVAAHEGVEIHWERHGSSAATTTPES